LDAADYGVPQRRERLFIVAIKNGLEKSFAWPEETHSKPYAAPTLFEQSETEYVSKPRVTLWQAISDLPQCLSDADCAHESYRFSPRNEYQRLMRAGAGNVIHNHEPMKHTKRIIERFSHIKYGESERHAPQTLRPRKRGASTEPSNSTYGQNSRRQDPDYPCNTIVASAHTNYIHPYLDRNFTVRETLRIQSFPDTFVMKGKRAVLSHKLSQRKGLMDDLHLDQRAQVGNAVPPLLAAAIARSVLQGVKLAISEAA
jgi:DNA (cytosine-5)-methyltransferase 1